MSRFVAISLGAIIGANARYLIGVWVAQRFATTFPLATLIINASGSLALGFFLILATERLSIGPEWRLLFAVGVLSSYTTFSSFSVETLALANSGRQALALGNVLLNVAMALAGAWLGGHLARSLPGLLRALAGGAGG